MDKRNITKKGIRYKQEFYWDDFMKGQHQKQVLIEPVDDVTIAVFESDRFLAYATKVGSDERKCRVCGCTWNHGCLTRCWWVEDDLCSSCRGLETGNRSEIDD